MTEQELRELDEWIAEKVVGYSTWDATPHGKKCWRIGRDGIRLKIDYCPTTDSAAAMAVLEKCAEKLDSFFKRVHITIDWHGGHWYCGCHPFLFQEEPHETLPLAICALAKQLFKD